MNSRMTRLTFAVAAFCLTGTLLAQDIHSDVAITRGQDEADRKIIVAATLNLSETDSEAFWPLYQSYRNDMAKTGDRTWKMLIEFADKYGTLTDAEASKMLDEVLAVEKQRNDIKTKWMKKMRKDIPASTVARFYQIDNKIDTLLRLDAAVNVPLVEKAQ